MTSTDASLPPDCLRVMRKKSCKKKRRIKISDGIAKKRMNHELEHKETGETRELRREKKMQMKGKTTWFNRAVQSTPFGGPIPLLTPTVTAQKT